MAKDDRHSRILFCGECHEACEIAWEDVGIGSYEFWGAPGVDVQLEPMSDCCSADIFIDVLCTQRWDPNDYQPDYEPED